MSGWTLRPPMTPGRYEYRETQYEPVQAFIVVAVEGEMMAEFPSVWMSLTELGGEWRRVLSERQCDRRALKGRA